MSRRRIRFFWIFAGAATLLGGCGGTGPYIHQPREFNRNAEDFGKEPSNIDSVTICYNKFGTKPEIVAKMASAECARFNKKAEFRGQSYMECVLVAPVAAIYDCVGGQETK